MSRNTALVEIALVLPIALGVAYLIARTMQALFGKRLSLPLSVMTIVSVLGLSIGLLLGGWFDFGLRLWMPATLLLAFGSSLGLSLLVAAGVAVVRRDRAEIDLAAVLAAGESDRVEFKETARWNVREGRKDPRMELAIAKTIAGFLNSGGGTLVIGANDAGAATGLDRDLATLRVPDHDRFELWLRDLLSTLLGRSAAALPRLQFSALAEGIVVCGVQCPPAPAPVFLSQAKDGSATDLWVRVGNSTRALSVDEAVAYAARHWRPSLAVLLLGRPVSR